MALYSVRTPGGILYEADTAQGPAQQLVDSAGNTIWSMPAPGTADAQVFHAGQFGFPVRTATAVYDFAVLGGAVSTIPLTGLTGIPANAVIIGGVLYVITAPTSADSTATIALQVNAANDIVAAAAVSGAPWSTTGLKAIVPIFTAATYKLTTAARDISAVIAVEALTAGKFALTLLYVPMQVA